MKRFEIDCAIDVRLSVEAKSKIEAIQKLLNGGDCNLYNNDNLIYIYGLEESWKDKDILMDNLEKMEE